MNKLTGLLDNFLYELSAYLLPGFFAFILLQNFYRMVNMCKTNRTFNNLSLWNYSNYDVVYWIFLLILSYILGMIISGLVFLIIRIDKSPCKKFTIGRGIYRILKVNPIENSLVDIRAKLRKELGSSKNEEEAKKIKNKISDLEKQMKEVRREGPNFIGNLAATGELFNSGAVLPIGDYSGICGGCGNEYKSRDGYTVSPTLNFCPDCEPKITIEDDKEQK